MASSVQRACGIPWITPPPPHPAPLFPASCRSPSPSRPAGRSGRNRSLDGAAATGVSGAGLRVLKFRGELGLGARPHPPGGGDRDAAGRAGSGGGGGVRPGWSDQRPGLGGRRGFGRAGWLAGVAGPDRPPAPGGLRRSPGGRFPRKRWRENSTASLRWISGTSSTGSPWCGRPPPGPWTPSLAHGELLSARPGGPGPPAGTGWPPRRWNARELLGAATIPSGTPGCSREVTAPPGSGARFSRLGDPGGADPRGDGLRGRHGGRRDQHPGGGGGGDVRGGSDFTRRPCWGRR